MPRSRKRRNGSLWPGMALGAAIVLIGAAAVFAAQHLPGSQATATPVSAAPSAVHSAHAAATAKPASPATPSHAATPRPTPAPTPASWTGLRDSGARIGLGDVTQIVAWPGGMLARPANEATAQLQFSTDGRTWTASGDAGTFGGESGELDGIAWNGKQLLAAGSVMGAVAPTPSIWTSADGRSWKSVDTGGSFDPGQRLVNLVANGTAFVGATQDGEVWRSADGTSWTSATLPGASNVRVVQLVATSKAFAIVGLDGGDGAQVPNKGVTIWSSADGRTWYSKVLSSTDWAWERVFVLDDRFVSYEGADSAPTSDSLPTRAWQSADGATWTSLAIPPATFHVVGSNGSRLVAQAQMRKSGAPFVLDQSADGVHWTALPIAGDTSQLEVVRAVVAGGVFVSKSPVGALEYYAVEP